MASEMVIVEKIKILEIQFIALNTKSVHLEQEFCSAHLLPGIEKKGKTVASSETYGRYELIWLNLSK